MSDTVMCQACVGTGHVNPTVGTSDSREISPSRNWTQCIPCEGTGRVPQRYPVRG